MTPEEQKAMQRGAFGGGPAPEDEQETQYSASIVPLSEARAARSSDGVPNVPDKSESPESGTLGLSGTSAQGAPMPTWRDTPYAQQVQPLRSAESALGSLSATKSLAPDQAARAADLAKKHGLDFETAVRTLPEIEEYEAEEDTRRVLSKSPKTSAWLENPINAAVARDSVTQLAAIEAKASEGGAYFSWSAVGAGLYDAPQSMAAGLRTAPAAGYGLLSAQLEAGARGNKIYGPEFVERFLPSLGPTAPNLTDMRALPDFIGDPMAPPETMDQYVARLRMIPREDRTQFEVEYLRYRPFWAMMGAGEWYDRTSLATSFSALQAAASYREEAQTHLSAGEAMMPEAESDLERDIQGGFFSLAKMAPAVVGGAVTRDPKVAMAMMGSGVGGESYVTAREEGLDPAQAGEYMMLMGGIEMATEKLPFDMLLKPLLGETTEGVVKRVLKYQLTEQATEQVATAAQDFVDWQYLNPEGTWEEYIAARPEAARSTFVSTLVASGSMQTTTEVIAAVLDTNKPARAEQDARGLEEMRALIEDTPAFERRREAVQDLVREATGDTEVFLDGNALTELYQTDAAFANVLSDLGFTDNDIARAMAGEDLTVSTASLLTIEKAEAENFQKLVDIMRTTPGAMTLAEARAAREASPDVDFEAIGQMLESDVVGLVEYEAVQQAVQKQLIEAGRSPQEARAAGAVWGSLVRVLEERGLEQGGLVYQGQEVTAIDVLRMMNLQIGVKSEQEEAGSRSRFTRSQTDGVPNWEGPVPRRPQTFTQWIRSVGGINDEGGEVSAILGGANALPGVISNLKREGRSSVSGKSLQQIAEMAVEQGYIPISGDGVGIDGATADQVLDLLRADVAGNNVFPIYNTAQDGNDAAMWEAYTKWAEQAGVLTPYEAAKEAREARKRGAPLLDDVLPDDAADPNVLEQAQSEGYEGQNRSEAVEWLRAKAKGLDMSTEARMARAKEMGFDTDTVLYHGTGADFDEFDPQRFGSSTRARSAKEGVWLTSSRDTAAGYSDLAASRKVQDLIDEAEAAGRKGDWSRHDNLMEQAERLEFQEKQPPIVKELLAAGKLKTIDMEGAQYDPQDTPLTEIIEQAKSEGFEGVKLNNFSDEGAYGVYRPTTHVLIFDPSNIRSVNAAFDPEYSDSAKLLAQSMFSGARQERYSEEADQQAAERDMRREQAERDAMEDEQIEALREQGWLQQGGLAFYSALERFVSEHKQGKASADQWKGIISKAPGIKAEEIEWTGVNDWLDAQEGPVTREALAAYLDNNGVQVDEVVKGGTAQSDTLQRLLLPLIEERDDLQDTLETDYYAVGIQNDPDHPQYQEMLDLEDRRYELDAEIDNIEGDANEEDGDTKWSSWTLPGGENYTELLLTLPEKPVEAILSIQENSNGSFSAVNQFGIEEGRYTSRVAAEDAVATAKRYGLAATPFKAYNSTHWSEQNVLAHARFKTRFAPDGSRVLALEEIQSDWHQDGRKRGYKGEVDVAALEEKKAASRRKIDQSLNAIIEILHTDAMKPVLDGPGLTRSERTVLEQPPKSIFVLQNSEKDSLLRAVQNTMRNPVLSEDTRRDLQKHHGEILSAQLDNQEAAFAISREMHSVPNAPFKNNAWVSLVLKRMIRYAAENGFDSIAWIPGNIQNGQEVDANDDRADFYNKIVPNAANKLGKKYGVKVDKITMNEPQIDPDTQFWALPITSELRKAALEAGFSLFQTAPTFYSALERFVSEHKQAKASADQWKGIISKAPGIKAEEIEWTGIMDVLDHVMEKGRADGKGSWLTREELAELISNRGVNVETIIAEEGEDAEGIAFDDGEVWDADEAWEWRVEDEIDFLNEDRETYEAEAFEKIKLDEASYIEENKDPDEDIDDYVQREFSDEIQELTDEIILEAARESARVSYFGDPIMIYTMQGDLDRDIYIFGNDDSGYSVRVGDWSRYENEVARDIWSLSEAQIQAREYAEQQGLINGSGTAARWGEYVTRGYSKNYREIKLTLPDNPGEEFVYSSHFDDPNIVAFLRVTDRKLNVRPDASDIQEADFELRWEPWVGRASQGDDFGRTGDVAIVVNGAVRKRVPSARRDFDRMNEIFASYQNSKSITFDQEQMLARLDDGVAVKIKGGKIYTERTVDGTKDTFFIEELQSDWHQQGRQNIYDTPAERKRAQDMMRSAEDEVEALTIKVREVFHETEPNRGWMAKEMGPNGPAYIRSNTQALSRLYELNSSSPTTPDQRLVDLNERIQDANRRALKAEDALSSKAIPDAPFKGDAWINLALKKAIMQAVEDGKSALAWADAEVVKDRWSDRYADLYENIYNRKLVKFVKKLTGQNAQHFTLDGEPYTEENAEDGDQGYWVIEITDELKEKVAGGFPLFQNRKQGQQARGSVRIPGVLTDMPGAQIFGPEQTQIDLTNADKSTFMHETAHIFLEVYAALEAENSGIASVMNDIRAYLKLEPGQRLTRDQHEKFAESFEVYLMEGKAPTPELRTAFQQFKAWLTEIYRRMRDQLRGLSPDAREIFDRMLATDDEIQRASAAYSSRLNRVVRDIMTPEQVEKHEAYIKRAGDVARDTLFRKHVEQVKRRQRKMMKQDRERLTKQFTDEVESQSVYRALADHGDGRALNPNVDVEMIAPDYGFSTGEDLEKAIAKAPRKETVIKRRVRDAMDDLHGNLLTDGSAAMEAIDAVYNEANLKALEVERDAAALKAARETIPLNTIKARARARINEMPLSEVITPGRYAIRARDLHKRSIREAAKGNWAQAMTLTQQAMYHHELARLAFKAVDEVGKINRYLGRFLPNRKLDPKKIAPEYIGAIREIMSLPGADNQQAVMQRLRDFADKMQMDGWPVSLPSDVLADSPLPLRKSMTLVQLREFRDGVKNLNKLGRENSEAAREAFRAEVSALSEEVRENYKGKEKYVGPNKTLFERTGSRLRQFESLILRYPFLIEALQGEKSGAIVETLETGLRRQLTMRNARRRDMGQRLVKIMERHKISQGEMGKRYTIPELDSRPVTFEAIFAMALNMGNESNRQRVDSDPRTASLAEIEAVLFERLEKRHWDAVQDIWDLIDELWPEASAVEKRMTGVAPKKVEAQSVLTPHGTYRGGYYPLKYEGEYLENADLNMAQEADLWKQSVNGMATHAVTKKGHLKDRAETVTRPVRMSLDTIMAHIDDVTNDIYLREEALKLSRIYRSPIFREALFSTHGKEYLDTLETVLKRVVHGTERASNPVEGLFRTLRVNGSVAILGANVRTALLAPVSYFQTVVPRYGVRTIMDGITSFYMAGPAARKRILEKSAFMRERVDTLNREAHERVRKAKLSDKWSKVQGAGFWLMTEVEIWTVSGPVWMGVYKDSLAKGMSETDAVTTADRAVATTQGSGLEIDQSILQGGNEFQRALTFMWGYVSGYYGIVRNDITKAQGYAKLWPIAKHLIILNLVASMLEATMRMIGTDDEDEDPYVTAVGDMMKRNVFGMIPGVSTVFNRYGSESPAMAAGQSLAQTAQAWISAAEELYEKGEIEGDTQYRLARKTLTSLGITFGVPGTIQADKTVRTLVEDDDPTLTEMLLTGPDKDN